MGRSRNAVMTGFLSGLGLLTILGQVGDLTGYHSDAANRFFRSQSAWAHAPRQLPRCEEGEAALNGSWYGPAASTVLPRVLIPTARGVGGAVWEHRDIPVQLATAHQAGRITGES